MANNPYVNKVQYGNQTLMDLTNDDVTPADVAEGVSFHDRSGAQQTGTGNYYSPNDTAETVIADNDYFPFYDTSATAKRKSLWSNIKAAIKNALIGPTPSASLTEDDIVTAIRNVLSGANDQVPSLFGIQKWSNTMTKKFEIPSASVGHYGVGTWTNGVPTDAEMDTWFHHAGLYIPDAEAANANIELKISYDNSKGQTIALGGYLYETDHDDPVTGNHAGAVCIKFANRVYNPSIQKIFVELVYTRTEIN